MPFDPKIHERRFSRAGTPMRRFRDYEVGDTFRWYGFTMVKFSAQKAQPLNPDTIMPVTFNQGQWFCEY